MPFLSAQDPMALALSLTPAVTGWLVPLVVGILKRSAKRVPHELIAGRVVRYSRSMRFIMLMGWIFFLVLSFASTPIVYDKPEGWKGILVLSVLLGMSTILRMETSLLRITWDERYIYTQSAWRASRVIPISAVCACDFLQQMHLYRIHTEGHGTVLAHQYAVGVGEFLQVLPCETPAYPPE